MNAYETLGIREDAPEDEIRKAYRTLAKSCHPDLFTDSEEQARAQEKMVRLNLAYKEAMRQCAEKKTVNYYVLPPEKAWACAKSFFSRGEWDRALVQLSHIEKKDAAWYDLQGSILMQMGQHYSAMQAYKIAVRMEPDNQEYHSHALEAAVAVKKHQTMPYRIADWAKGLLRGRGR